MANNRYANLSFPELMILQHAHKHAANLPTSTLMTVYELAEKERIPLRTIKAAIAAAIKAYGKNNNSEAQWEKEERMKAAIKKVLASPPPAPKSVNKALPKGFTGTVNPLSAIKARKTRKAKKTRRSRRV